MTKIIDKLDEKVNETAFRLFAEKGYSGVTMKMVAEDVGISVGTLYNYYSNKQDLFISVFKKVFDQTYLTLESIIERDGNAHEFISVLYDEVVRLQGFSRELMRDKINHEVIDNLRDHLLMLMSSLIYRAEEKKHIIEMSEKDKERSIRLLILAMHDFARKYPEDREENIDFICRLANKIR
ncbi:MAG: helix-turn-helix domain-containing protein [Candidatus Caldatribacteriota bacterium]